MLISCSITDGIDAIDIVGIIVIIDITDIMYAIVMFDMRGSINLVDIQLCFRSVRSVVGRS
eukprot:3691227-Lingulodinium_polyedra.AAC.1